MQGISCREALDAEVPAICALVRRVFLAWVAPHYTVEGVETFLAYVEPHLMRARVATNHVLLVADYERTLVGMIEVRDLAHVSLLFVETAYQGLGIGRLLWEHALTRCLEQHPTMTVFTVHASPNAVAAYERLGFCATAGEQTAHGMRYLPMAHRIESARPPGPASGAPMPLSESQNAVYWR